MKKIFSLFLTVCFLVSFLNIPVFTLAADTNLALPSNGAILTASHSANTVGNAVDAKSSTFWQGWTSDASIRKYIQVELADYTALSKVRFSTETYNSAEKLSVLYSTDGEDWTTVGVTVDTTTTPRYFSVTFTSANARYVRITHTSNTTSFKVNEIEIYGTPSNPYLTEITPSFGTLSPSFDKSKANYEIVVDSFDSLPSLSYTKAEEGAQVDYTEAEEANGYKAEIKVTHIEVEFTYTVQFKEPAPNPTLASLASSDDSTLSPSFDKDVLNYTLDLKTATQNDILPTLEYETAEDTATAVFVPASTENNYTATITVTHKEDSKVYSVQYLFNYAHKDNALSFSATGYDGSGYTADKAIDGNTDSEWRSNPYSNTDSEAPYLQVEFKKFVNIRKLGIYSTYSANQANYKFSYSLNGVDWTDAAGSYYRNGSDLTLTLNSSVAAKYVRVAVNTANTTFIRVKEFYAFGVENEANPFLSSLSASEGEITPSFDPNVTSYELPVYSATNLPTLSYVKAEPSATDVSVAASAENDYTASVTVTHNSIPVTYKVKYNLVPENSTELKYIKVSADGSEPTTVEGFDKAKTKYLLDCNNMVGVPVVSAEAVHKDAVVEIRQGSIKNMTATIAVTAADGVTTQEYELIYLTNIALNCSAWANSAYSGYEATDALDGNLTSWWFASSKVVGGGYIAVNLECMAQIYNMTVYNDNTSNTAWYNDIQISTDGTSWTEVTGFSIKSSEVTVDGVKYYKMDYTFENAPIQARYIRVSGKTTSTNNTRIAELVVNGLREPMVSADTSLKEIKIDAAALTGFSSFVSDYTVTLGASDSIPVVTATAVDIAANVVVTQATDIDPVAKIVVTAENGVSQRTYTVTFEKELAAEKNTYLSALSFARGMLVPAFTPANTSYTLYLPQGSGAITESEITAAAQISDASVVKSAGSPVTVTVTSQDTTERRTYTINVEYASADLLSLTATGYEMTPAFSPSVTDYTIELIAGEGLPLIGILVDGKHINPVAVSGATVSLVQPTQETLKAVITVTSENGILKKNYTITFKYLQSLKTAQAAVQEALKTLSVSNQTTADSIMQLVQTSITNDAISSAWTNPFSLTAATTTQTGLITGTITLSFGGESVAVPIRKAIDKLNGSGDYVISSGGGGGGGGGISTKPKDEEIPDVNVDPYAEIRGHWAEKEVIYLAEQGIVKGNGSSFALNDEVTRAEFITMLIRAGKFGTKTYANAFTDVAAKDWYAIYLQSAKDNGFVEGYNGQANPNGKTTRQEAVKMLIGVYEKLYGISEADIELDFTDSVLISDWAVESIEKAVAWKLVTGYDTGAFGARDILTRAQAMTLVYRLMNVR